MFALRTYHKSRKKQNYMVNTGRSKLLDSFFFENQIYRAWKGYVIAKNKDEYEKMVHYARVIQENQYDLGLEVSSFPNIGMSATSFLWELVQKDNDSQQRQEVAEEEEEEEENYLDDAHYERERFTDTYSEYFEDDENKAERFTDDYREDFTD
jgi:hypothetical protein